MRVVLDTNVLISGTFWTGDSFRILSLIDSGKFTLILSKEILEEYDRVLHSDEILEKSAYREEKAMAVRRLLAMATIIVPTSHVRVVTDDPDDDKFLDAAMEGKAGFIVSQDQHLLKLKEFQNIRILTPQELLRLEP